jgi:hypothetical protein
MPFDKFVDIDTITEERSKAIEKSIRTISIEELKKLGEEIFHYSEDPWRQTLLRLIEQHPTGTFYHATTHDRVTFLYCQDEDIGLWVLPGSGMGPLRETGKGMMKKAIKHSH